MIYLLRGGARLRADGRARPALDARAAHGGRRRAYALVGGLRRVRVRRRLHHYTSVFALAGQLAWLLWAHPEARKPALAATAGARRRLPPWLRVSAGTWTSATTDILSALQPFTLSYVKTASRTA